MKARRSDCPIACALDLIGDKWTLLIVRDFFFGKHRFSQFLASGEGITTNILTERLKRLERAGLIERSRYQEHPPRYEYHLSAPGRTLEPVVQAIVGWGRTNIPGTRESQLEPSKSAKDRRAVEAIRSGDSIAPADLRARFGAIDIYLFDQLLRRRISPSMKVLDTGCGEGRNLQYLMRAGIEVFGIDRDPQAIEAVRALAAKLAPRLPGNNFRCEIVEAMTFPDQSADFVISNAVLHFAGDEAHFWSMLHGSWRVLRPGGHLFCRLASTIGCEESVRHLEDRRFLLPDGTERFLVDEALLSHATARLGGDFADPLKTTLVRDRRSMTTWVVRKLR